jgi:uncharacterized membrane protein
LTRWRRASIALGTVGLAISGYLSIVHAFSGQVPLLCSTSGLVNCEQVTTSAESFVGPLPVAYLGLVWFLVMLGLIAVPLQEPETWWGTLRLAWAAIGTVFVIYLMYAELFLIGAICLWCTAIHVVVIALFLLEVGTFGGSIEEITTAR